MEERAKAQLLDAYYAAAKVTPPDFLESKRQAFLAKYPPSALGSLTGDELMHFVHGDAPRTGLFYDLEFGNIGPGFGGIGGGSALKFKIYAASDGSGYRKKQPVGNAPMPCSDAEAERITSDIVHTLDRTLRWADELDLAKGDRDNWVTFNKRIGADRPVWYGSESNEQSLAFLVWIHKYLAIARPDLFPFHHRWINLISHMLRLGIEPTPGAGRYLLDWQWREIIRGDTDLRNLYPPLLMEAAYALFGTQTQYWRVGTTEGDIDRWPTMQSGGFVSVGWNKIGDLNILLAGDEGTAAKARLKELIASLYDKVPAVAGRQSGQLLDFFTDIKVGDRIVAMRGQTLLGVGVVTGSYQFLKEDLQPHHLPVKWYDTTPEQWPETPGLMTAVKNFTDDWNKAVRVEHALLHAEPLPVSVYTEPDTAPQQQRPSDQEMPLTKEAPLTKLEEQIRGMLKRQGQIILYGPPGTGKTYNGRQAAREIAARERAGGRDWAMLTPTQRAEIDAAAITFTTFHPAYGYEDFIEGYRPLPPSEGGGGAAGLSFEPRDGVFLDACAKARQSTDLHHFLIIDEINRGNVAAVLGELITLLEADKRDDLQVVLPISRRPFSVPKNLWIIGTINTADRSISLLDTALRRRFGFVELLPEPERVAVTVEGLSLAALLTEINARIRKYVTRNARELQVGHAYLMRGGKPLGNREDVQAAFRDGLLPLLAEYCFENYGTLARIVGDEIIDTVAQVPRAEIVGDTDRLHLALLQLVSADPARTTNLGSGEDDEDRESTDDETADSEDDGVGIE